MMFGSGLITSIYTSSAPPTGTGGYGGADFYLGLPTNYGRGVSGGEWGQRSSALGAYIQDDWRATNNLTVNLGLRYEIHTPWVEVNDHQVNFDLFTGQVLAQDCSDRKSTRLNSSHTVISYAAFYLKKNTAAERARLRRI